MTPNRNIFFAIFFTLIISLSMTAPAFASGHDSSCGPSDATYTELIRQRDAKLAEIAQLNRLAVAQVEREATTYRAWQVADSNHRRAGYAYPQGHPRDGFYSPEEFNTLIEQYRQARIALNEASLTYNLEIEKRLMAWENVRIANFQLSEVNYSIYLHRQHANCY